MTKSKLKKLIIRAHSALISIPGGQTGMGAPTASMRGMIEFQNDIMYYRKFFTRFVYAIIDDEDDYAEKAILDMEELASKYSKSVNYDI